MDTGTGVRQKRVRASDGNGYGSYHGYVVVENAGAYLRMTPSCIFIERIGLQKCYIAYFRRQRRSTATVGEDEQAQATMNTLKDRQQVARTLNTRKARE